MDFSYVMNAITDNILIPIFVVIGSAVALYIKSYFNKLTKSQIAKNDAEALEKLIEVRSKIYQQVSDIVKTAVASNMQLAAELKAKGEKLSDEDITILNEKAKNMISATLAPQINDENVGMLEIIGGQEVLNQIIDGLIEKYVFEYKAYGTIKSSSNSKPQQEDLKTKYSNKKKKPSTLSESTYKFIK